MNTNPKSIIPISKKLSSFITVFAAFLFLAFSAQVASAAKTISVSGNLNFGNVSVGTSAQLIMVVSNAGNNTLQLNSVTLPAGFTTGITNKVMLSAGEITNIVVTFTPTAVTNYSGTATVNSDATSGPNTLPVSGAGVAASIALSGNLSFGSVAIGATPQQTLVISNSGSGVLVVSNITYPAGFSGSFSGSIAQGSSTNVAVTFSPTAVTNYGGTVTVNSTALSGVNTIAASGTGLGALISVSGNLSFGNVAVGATPQQTLTISNSGNATLNVTSISYPAGFSGSFSGAIAAGTATNVAVTFAPAAVQSYGGTVTVSSDAFTGGNTIAASGTGLGGIPTFSGDLTFSNTIVGSSSQATVTVTNTGNAPLTISNLDLPPGFSGSFSGTIPPGGTTNITILFSPTDATNYTGTVTVNSDAPGGPFTFGVTGTGIAQTRIISLSGNLTFTDTLAGQFAQLTLSITNSGNSTLTVSSIDYPTGFSGAFSGSLVPGASTNVTVTFSPTNGASYSGTVTVNSDATSGANTVTASGNGIALTRVISLSGDLNFPDTLAGQFAQLTLSITNSGNSTLTVSSIDYPTGFSGAFSGSLVPGASTNVTVTFSPTNGASYSGTVTVNSDATSGVNTVTASGNGIALSRIISLSGDLNFGTIFPGTSTTLTLSITNSGNSSMTVSGIDYPTGFSGAFSGTLAPGASTNVTVTFAPTDSISYSGTVTVNSDATSGVNTVNASGQGTVLTRVISLSADLDFGSIFVGSSAQLTLTVTNSGNSDLTFTNVEFPSGFSGDITNGTIAPGATTNINVTFSPSSATTFSGTVTVDSDATSGVNTANVTGTGTLVPTRIISLSGDLNFSDTIVGNNSQLTLTITNDGNATLTFGSITLPSGFTSDISSGAIAPGASTNVTVTFSPTDTVSYSGTITVTSDATSGTNTVNVSGLGIAPTRVISLSGDLDFGDVTVNTSTQLTLTITNSGNSPMTVSSIDYPTGFSGAFSGTLAPGATTNVTVTFSPTLVQAYSGTVTVNSDATSGVDTVNASGNGVAAVVPTRIIVLSGDLDFGDVEVGIALDPLTLVISNAGNSTLTISNISLPADFSGNFSGTIAAGASQIVAITFTPSVNQTYSGTLTVASDATGGVNTVNVAGDAFDYTAAKSKFAGLFYPTNDVQFDNSGYSSTKASKKRTFSAKIRLAGKQYPISGTLSQSGAFSGHISRKSLSTLNVTLQAGFDGGDRWKGVISDDDFTAKLVVNRSTYNKKKNPAPLAGVYDLTIASSGDSSIAPTTNGTAKATIIASGVTKILGKLGDGAPVIQTTFISKEGQVPFYGSLYSKKGSIIGWLNFTNDPGNEVNGMVGWFKPAGIDSNYPNGFQFLTTVSGSRE